MDFQTKFSTSFNGKGPKYNLKYNLESSKAGKLVLSLNLKLMQQKDLFMHPILDLIHL